MPLESSQNQVQTTKCILLTIWFVCFWNEFTKPLTEDLLVENLFRARICWISGIPCYPPFLKCFECPQPHTLFLKCIGWQSPSFSLLKSSDIIFNANCWETSPLIGIALLHWLKDSLFVNSLERYGQSLGQFTDNEHA